MILTDDVGDERGDDDAAGGPQNRIEGGIALPEGRLGPDQAQAHQDQYRDQGHESAQDGVVGPFAPPDLADHVRTDKGHRIGQHPGGDEKPENGDDLAGQHGCDGDAADENTQQDDKRPVRRRCAVHSGSWSPGLVHASNNNGHFTATMYIPRAPGWQAPGHRPDRELAPSVFAVPGDKPDRTGGSMLAIKLRVPAVCAAVAVVDFIFHTEQTGVAVRMVDACVHCHCFHCVNCGIAQPTPAFSPPAADAMPPAGAGRRW